MKKYSCFYNSVRPTMYLSCITGVMPAFPLKLKQTHQTVHTGGMLNMIILIYLISYLFSIVDRANTEGSLIVEGTYYETNVVSKIGLQLFLLLSIFSLLVVYIGGLLLPNKLKSLYKIFFKLDNEFRSIGVKFPYRKYFYSQILIYVTMYMTSAMILVIRNRFTAAEGMKSYPIFHWFAICTPHILQLTLVLQFNNLLFFIYCMFRKINERLASMKTGMGNKNVADFQVKEIIFQISKLMKLHYKLCDLVDLFTSIYGIAILTTYVAYFFSTIMFVVGVIAFIPQHRPLTTLCYVFWACQRIFEFTTVCLMGELVKTTASSTKQWINKLIIETSHSELINKLDEFSLQLQYKRAAVIVVDMLEINANLILKLWTSVFGYIILVYQFKKRELE